MENLCIIKSERIHKGSPEKGKKQQENEDLTVCRTGTIRENRREHTWLIKGEEVRAVDRKAANKNIS